jgi:hypothetical protein
VTVGEGVWLVVVLPPLHAAVSEATASAAAPIRPLDTREVKHERPDP